MLSEKKLTMEDTWKTGDLEKHMRRGVYDEDNMRRKDRRSRDEEGKKDRSGDLEQRHRGHERNAPRERERHSERDATGRRTKPRDPDGDKDQDRQREGMRDRTGERDERDRERRREREREGERDRERDSNRPRDRDREIREKQHERAEKDSRDREKRHERGEKDSRDRDRRHERGEKDSRDRDRRHERAEKDSRDRQHERAEKDSRDRERQYERAEKDSRDRDRRRERGEKDSRDRDRRRERGEKDSRDRRHERAEKDSRDRQHEKVEKDSRDRERQYERAEKDSRDRERQYNRAENDSRDRRHEREEKDSRDKERKRRRAELDREQGTEKERRREQGRDGDREKDRERTRERDRDRERDRETDYDRRREKERHGDRERDLSSKHVKEMNDYKNELQEKYLESKRESERRERYGERDHSKRKEDKEYQEQRRKEKEEREKRHREREEEQPRDEERERRRRERREEARHRLPGGANSGVAESRDQPENRRPAKEGDRENGPVEVTSEARLHSRRDRERREAEEAEVEKDEAETEEVSAEGYEVDDGAEYYEEDFEDYEDDFDEVDESDREEDDGGEKSEEGPKEEEPSPQKRREIEEIRRAMNAENARVGSSQQRLAVEESEPSTRKNSEVPHRKNSQHGRFIDFVAAKQREVGKKIASKQKKRSTELLRLIDLDFSITFPLLDLTPVNEYDMYIKSFGTTNTKQAYVQCNEDSTDRDIQTEDIEADDKWTQHPGYGSTVCGGPKLISEASNESMAKMNIDSKRLAEFLLSASQVMAVLLEEDRAEMHSLRKLKSQAHSLSCSDGSVQLNTKLPFLHGREVSLLSFSHVQRQTLLSVHSPATNPSAVRLDSNTILCIWNIWEPSSPQKVLVYESEVLCCCFSPGRAALVFAGTAVGSVVVWDLREHSGLHQTLTIGDHDWTLRYPTFSTDAVLSLWSHSSSVRSVEAAPVAMAESARPELSLLPSHQESSGLSFELASLDESGVMNLWVVVELPKGDQAGSQTDLGLKPGGKVKLLHSSTLIINERSSHRDAVNTGPPRTLLLKFLPSDSNHFFIGTDMGLVTHGTRHGLKTVPKFYGPQEDGLRPVHITAVDVSPFGEPLFLVGSADGSIRLHSVSRGQPVAEWSRSTAGQPVLCVQWALTRPAVFCVLDAASNLHLWDLAEKDYEPVTTQKLHSDRVTAMAVFGDPAKPNTLSGVCLASQSGEIEVQYFSKRWAVPAPAELETLLSKLNEAF